MRTNLMLSTVVGLAASTAMAQDYYDKTTFENDASGGNVLQGVEDFEYPGGYFVAVGVDPLTQGVANGVYTQGTIQPISIQSNLMGDGGMTLQPRGGPQPLAFFEGGMGFSATDSVIANYFVDGLDVIMLNSDVTAIGFNPMVYSGSDTLNIQIFDTANNLLGTFQSPANQNETDFFGFISNGTPIGRVNLFGIGNNAEGADNISIWTRIPAPGAAALLGLGGLVAGRRRRA
jgi:hypothetical protein